jgi:hypothetical protein
MLRHTHRDTVEAGEREIGDTAIRLFSQHQRQRPRPEIRREFFSRRIENTNAPGRGDIRNMCDQRVE